MTVTHLDIRPQHKAHVNSIAPDAESSVYFQVDGAEYDIRAIEAQVRAAYFAQGYGRNSIRKLRIYIKPEDHAVYYVINEKKHGQLPLPD